MVLRLIDRKFAGQTPVEGCDAVLSQTFWHRSSQPNPRYPAAVRDPSSPMPRDPMAHARALDLRSLTLATR
jgi:hypothetical protein